MPDDFALSVIGRPVTTLVMIDAAFESDLSVVPGGKTPISNSYVSWVCSTPGRASGADAMDAPPEAAALPAAASAAEIASSRTQAALRTRRCLRDDATACRSRREELVRDLVERAVAAVGSEGIDEPGIRGLFGAPVGVEPDDFEIERTEPLRRPSGQRSGPRDDDVSPLHERAKQLVAARGRRDPVVEMPKAVLESKDGADGAPARSGGAGEQDPARCSGCVMARQYLD